MRPGFIAVFVAAAALALAPANAVAKRPGKRHAPPPRCVDTPYQFSWDFLWSTGNPPRANGCAPPVYESGRFVGQDPDPNVRLELRRNPQEGDFSHVR